MGYKDVTVHAGFEAAHMLSNYDGDCHNLHGHSYKVKVTLTCKKVESFDVPDAQAGTAATEGMVMDFRVLKSIVNDAIEQFDHAFLVSNIRGTAESRVHAVVNNMGLKTCLLKGHTTAENIGLRLFEEIRQRINAMNASRDTPMKLTVSVQETEGCNATCSRNI